MIIKILKYIVQSYCVSLISSWNIVKNVKELHRNYLSPQIQIDYGISVYRSRHENNSSNAEAKNKLRLNRLKNMKFQGTKF